MGFVDEGGFYVNNMDVKYLKIYRTDLDLAYKKYNEGKKNIWLIFISELKFNQIKINHWLMALIW